MDYATLEEMALAHAQPGDAALHVRFHLQPVEDKAASKAEGRPVWKDVEYVSIQAAGDRDVVSKPATDEHRRRWARQYAAFRTASSQEAVTGTLLNEWPLVTRAQVEEYRYAGIHTVEQLAAAADGALRVPPGFVTLKQKAQTWLAQAKDKAHAQALRTELAERDSRIAALEDMVRQLAQSAQKQQEEAPKKKRNEPPQP